MTTSTLKDTIKCDIQTIWDIVTNVQHYESWRSDLSKTEVLDDTHFIEYAQNGFATHFTITATDLCKRWEFDIDNANIRGHWTGLFTQEGGAVTLEFTETVSAKKWFMTPFLKPFLKKQQAQFLTDLKAALAQE